MNRSVGRWGEFYQFLWDFWNVFNFTKPLVNTLFDQCRVNIFDQVECGVHDRQHIYPLCGIFYFPWHRQQIEGTNGL